MSRHDFRYVPRNKTKPIYKELTQILHEVQVLVRDSFTFCFYPVGSYRRNMVTQDLKSSIGFDFDINIEVNDREENYEPKEIHNIMKNALNKVVRRHGYGDCVESTRVLAIKKVDRERCQIRHSCDFAIVRNLEDRRQQYIRFDKRTQRCTWEYQSKGYEEFEERSEWIRSENHMGELRDYYLEKKNNNQDPNKRSRAILAESVKEICDKLGYQNKNDSSRDSESSSCSVSTLQCVHESGYSRLPFVVCYASTLGRAGR